MNDENIELYKKYRPKKWSDLVGQKRTTNSLRNAVLQNKIPTAYIFAGERGCGKDLHKDTLLPTPHGFTTMGDVQIGDILLGSDGQPTRVLNKYCPMDPEIYEITFSDGTRVKTGSGHLWETYTEETRNNELKENPHHIVSTKEILNTKEKNHSVRTITQPAYFNNITELSIDPYVLGIWLGNKYSREEIICVNENDMEQIYSSILASNNTNHHTLKIKTFENKSIFSQLKELNLIENKHIPEEYLYSSVENRISLLRGLMDINGSIDEKGVPSFLQQEETLFNQVRILIHSLGWKTSINDKNIKDESGEIKVYKELLFYPDQQVFTLSRKAVILKNNISKWSNNVKHRYIVDVKRIIDDPKDYFCISVDSSDKLFLCTDSFIPTHNTSTAFILAKSLNCENLGKDGEPCNECSTCINIDNNTQLGFNYISMANADGVDEVRDIVKKALLNQPIKKQVWILDEVHNLSQKGWDALLIPLESTGMPSLFILCTTEVHKIPTTISSRIGQRKFNLVKPNIMLPYVKMISDKEGLDLDEDVLMSAVKGGRGSVRDTLTVLETIALTGNNNVSFGSQLLESLATRDISKVFTVIARAADEDIDFKLLTEQLFEDLRELLLIACKVDESLINIPDVKDVDKVIKGIGNKGGINILLNEVGDSINKMTFNADCRILLEIALLKSITSIKKAIAKISS